MHFKTCEASEPKANNHTRGHVIAGGIKTNPLSKVCGFKHLMNHGSTRMSDTSHSPTLFGKDKFLALTRSDASMHGHILNAIGVVRPKWTISKQDGAMTYFV